MGLCESKQCHKVVEFRVDKSIANHMEFDAGDDKRIVKVLLLGAGESGKSTVFKQMVKLHGNGFTQVQLNDQLCCAQKNAVESLNALIEGGHAFGAEYMVSKQNQDTLVKYIQESVVFNNENYSEPANPDIGKYIEILWQDVGVRSCFPRRFELQVPDCAEYFLDKSATIFAEDYQMTEEDLLRVRVRTTGMKEEVFELSEGTYMRVVDVGGQRSERKKWIHLFYDVHALLFVTAISEYNQVLFEDNSTNRFECSMQVWSETVNLESFSETPVILFLNKVDLLEHRVKDYPISDYLPDYNGSTLEDALEYMYLAHRSKMICPDLLTVHYTTALDTDLMGKILDNVRKGILDRVLSQAMQ